MTIYIKFDCKNLKAQTKAARMVRGDILVVCVFVLNEFGEGRKSNEMVLIVCQKNRAGYEMDFIIFISSFPSFGRRLTCWRSPEKNRSALIKCIHASKWTKCISFPYLWIVWEYEFKPNKWKNKLVKLYLLMLYFVPKKKNGKQTNYEKAIASGKDL